MKHVFWSLGQKLVLKDIVKAKNCHLYDSRGRKYVDLEAGIWSAVLGHSHPGVVRAIKKQAQSIVHTGFCYAHPVLEKASRQLLDLLGFEEGQCAFLSSGSEAVVYATKMMQAARKKPLLLAFSNAYFGSYGSAQEKSENEWYCFDWIKNCSGCGHSDNCDLECEHIQEIPFERIAGFVFEPGSSGLIRFPPEKLVQNLANKVKRADGIIAVNEVTTGLGRTGKWFGHQHYHLKPDIVALGKGLGNGYPVSAVAVTKEISSLLSEQSFYYCQSHQNDALGAAVAHEVIQVLKREGLVERSQRLGIYLKQKLTELAGKYSFVKDIRGRGLMMVIEFQALNHLDTASIIFQKLLKNGYIVYCRPNMNVIRLDPSLTVEKRDLEGFLECFAEVLNSMSDAL